MDHLRFVHVENVEEINPLCVAVIEYGELNRIEEIVMLKSFFDILFSWECYRFR